MWLRFCHYAICTAAFSKFQIPFMSLFFLFFLLISIRTYGLHIWEMLSMVAPSPRTRRLCVVIHIWSSLLLFIITHHYYKQVRSWLPSFWLQGKKKRRGNTPIILNFQRINFEDLCVAVTDCSSVYAAVRLEMLSCFKQYLNYEPMWARHVCPDRTPLKPSPSVAPL